MPAPALIPALPACPPPSVVFAPTGGGPRDLTVDVLARTLWGEGRSEPVRTVEAIAAVIINRFGPGGSVLEVRSATEQFPCWSPVNPDHPRMLAVQPGEPVFDTCLRIARRALSGLLPDRTGGATWYHHRMSFPTKARNRLPCAEIGNFLFYTNQE